MGLFGSDTVVTISLEGTSLRLLQVSGRRVVKWASVPFSSRLLKGGFVADASGLAQVLAKALQGADMPPKRAIGAVTGLQAVSRLITVPRAPGVSLDSVISREARRLMPVAAENNYLFWQPLDRKGGPQTRVFVLAVPRQPLLSLLEALEQAGTKPLMLDLKPLALFRAANQKDGIIGNVENTSVDVVIALEDVPVLMRSVSLGDEPLAPEYAAARLADELTRTISFYNDNNKANPLSPDLPVLLTGSLFEDETLAATVQTAVGRPRSQCASLYVYPEGFPIQAYMVNLGLAMKLR